MAETDTKPTATQKEEKPGFISRITQPFVDAASWAQQSVESFTGINLTGKNLEQKNATGEPLFDTDISSKMLKLLSEELPSPHWSTISPDKMAAELNRIAASVPEEEQEKMRQRLALIASDPNYLNNPELRSQIREYAYNFAQAQGLSKEQFDQALAGERPLPGALGTGARMAADIGAVSILGAMDTNADKGVSFMEFKAAMNNGQTKADLLGSLDINKDGSISKAELVDVLKASETAGTLGDGRKLDFNEEARKFQVALQNAGVKFDGSGTIHLAENGSGLHAGKGPQSTERNV